MNPDIQPAEEFSRAPHLVLVVLIALVMLIMIVRSVKRARLLLRESGERAELLPWMREALGDLFFDQASSRSQSPFRSRHHSVLRSLNNAAAGEKHDEDEDDEHDGAGRLVADVKSAAALGLTAMRNKKAPGSLPGFRSASSGSCWLRLDIETKRLGPWERSRIVTLTSSEFVMEIDLGGGFYFGSGFPVPLQSAVVRLDGEPAGLIEIDGTDVKLLTEGRFAQGHWRLDQKLLAYDSGDEELHYIPVEVRGRKVADLLNPRLLTCSHYLRFNDEPLLRNVRSDLTAEDERWLLGLAGIVCCCLALTKEAGRFGRS